MGRLKGTHLRSAFSEDSCERQSLIRDRFGEVTLREKQTELCFGCKQWKPDYGCIFHLFPMTLEAGPCPYRKEGKYDQAI